MPDERTLKYCVALSVLFHLTAMGLASFIPDAARRAEEVMVVDLADIPRSTDFLPPKPGVIRGARPAPVPPPEPPAAKARKEIPPPEEMAGPVPRDLPVDPGLPPEREFPAPRPKETASRERMEGPGKPAERARGPAAPAASPESPPAPAGGRKSLRDLTPSLGKMVMARAENGAGRGQETSRGTAAGTEAKAREKGEIAEERGGGAHLTPLNAPEIQYISYFAGIKRKIELVWQYPYEAQVGGIQGDLTIDFVIARNGALESVSLVDASGHKLLDEEALRSIRKAAPYDPIPPQYRIPNLQIRAHFIYEMHTLRLR